MGSRDGTNKEFGGDLLKKPPHSRYSLLITGFETDATLEYLAKTMNSQREEEDSDTCFLFRTFY